MTTSSSPSQLDIDQIFLEQAQSLCRGGELLPGGVKELARRLQKAAETRTPLKVKLGLDPTRPDLHLGHTVVLRKLRAFQDLGHEAILIIGDATAMIGDPSGRSATRPPLSEEEVQVNAQTYLDQAGKVIDVRKARIRRNSEWLSGMQLGDFLKLAGKVTAAQILAREDFAKRMGENKPIGLHELFYPLMQGYDSVEIQADIELGGTDQRFNNLMGRELQSAYGREANPQMVLLMPLLEGTDGKIKMSKSYPEHCINLTDTAEDIYGKIMSIPDELMTRYELLLGLLNEEQIAEQTRQMQAGHLHPRDVKSHLGKYIVALYHGQEAAQEAEQAFIARFKNKEILEKDIIDVTLKTNIRYSTSKLMIEHGGVTSGKDALRLIQGGGVRLNGHKITVDPEHPNVAPHIHHTGKEILIGKHDKISVSNPTALLQWGKKEKKVLRLNFR